MSPAVRNRRSAPLLRVVRRGCRIDHAGDVPACQGWRRRGLTNVVAINGDVQALPFPATFSIVVVSRLAFHRWGLFFGGLADDAPRLPSRNVVAVADLVAPSIRGAQPPFHEMERLRDPSHIGLYPQADSRASSRRSVCPPPKVHGTVSAQVRGWLARYFPDPRDVARSSAASRIPVAMDWVRIRGVKGSLLFNHNIAVCLALSGMGWLRECSCGCLNPPVEASGGTRIIQAIDGTGLLQS